MTLPLLLLGLYAGLLALSLGLSSWVTHDHPTEAGAQRVIDAAERAAFGQLAGPAQQAAGTILAIAAIACVYSSVQGGPIIWFTLAPIVVPLLVAAAIYHGTRKLIRTTGQLVDMAGADQRVSLTSRSVLATVLCCETAIGLAVLGLFTLVQQELGEAHSLSVVILGTFSTSAAAVVFARASSATLLTTGQIDPSTPSPHPASLAVLVAEAFHGPLVRLLTLVVLSTFGHLALLLHLGADESANTLWLFPHLLKLLGLFALVFSGMVVRSHEDEGSAGWTRSTIVFFVLMIAGAWALSSELPEAWARSVPSGLTFFFLLIGAAAFAAPKRVASQFSQVSGLLHEVTARAGSLGIFVVLLLVLVVATSIAPPEVALPGGALARLIMAGAVATVPLAVCWHLASEVSDGSNQCAALAHAGQVSPVRPSILPQPGLLAMLPLLCCTAVISAMSGTLLSQVAISGPLLLLWSFGALVGAAMVLALLGSLERVCIPAGQKIASMILGHQAMVDPSGPLNFEAAVQSIRRDSSRGVLVWMLVLASSSLLTLVLRYFLPVPHFQSLAFGLALGAITAGTLIAWSLGDSESQVKRTFGRLALVTGLVQATWLFTTTLAQS